MKEKMKFKTNSRGFTYGEFTDLHNEKCSLQKSSAAMYDAIWLGIDTPVPFMQTDGQWQEINLPKGTSLTGRMHLSQKIVRDILPALTYFAEHGELPDNDLDIAK